jgi:SAM-dependent methyltransferase
MSLIRTRMACALCACVDMDTIMKLPATPPANEFVQKPQAQERFPLDLQLCRDCGHVQLADVVHPDRLFGNYVYVSGTSPVFVKHFEDYAQDVYTSSRLSAYGHVVDIGSNDGTLLKAFQKLGVKKVTGVDPARDIASKATSEGVPTRIGFFDRNMAAAIRATEGAANVITANNVFAHADDLREIALGVRDLLAPEGDFVFEVSYLMDVVEHTLFDTIYHEHLSYHSVKPLVPFLAECGLHVYDALRVQTHGGSVRVYASRARKHPTSRLASILAAEEAAGIQKRAAFDNLSSDIAHKAEILRKKIKDAKTAGKKICGFGAPAKLTTLMYAFGLDAADFEFIIDDSPLKQGLLTPGMNIPVCPSTALYERNIDVCVVFAWNFFDSITTKHAKWADAGGVFVNPLN